MLDDIETDTSLQNTYMIGTGRQPPRIKMATSKKYENIETLALRSTMDASMLFATSRPLKRHMSGADLSNAFTSQALN